MKFQDPFAVTCPHCETAQRQPVLSLLKLVATCNACGKSLDEVGARMRSMVNDWSSYIGRIELAMALERRFKCSISDGELESALTADAYVSLIRRKVGGLTDEEVFGAIGEALRSLNPEFTDPAMLAQPLHELLSKYGRTDA